MHLGQSHPHRLFGAEMRTSVVDERMQSVFYPSRETARPMPSIINKTVFSEPSGRPIALVQLSGALLLLGVYGYYVVVEYATLGSVVPFLIAGMALSGIAESLPKTRRRAAGALRLTALLILVNYLVIINFTPELLAA